jgi:hypothetical protein
MCWGGIEMGEEEGWGVGRVVVCDDLEYMLGCGFYKENH